MAAVSPRVETNPVIPSPLTGLTQGEAERTALRLRVADDALRSGDPFMREAGAQMLAGVNSPEPLSLLENACRDSSPRVQNAALSALTQAVAQNVPDAEATLLRILTRYPLRQQTLREADTEQLGALPATGFDARRLRFLAARPDLLKARLKAIETGDAGRVQAYRSDRLRNNPSVTAFFETLRHDPGLPFPLKTMLARRKEFRNRPSGEPRSLEPFWRDIRRLTGLLAAIGADPAVTSLINLVMDRTAERDTTAFWKTLTNRIPFVPELVVGAGPHGANFCSTLATLRPACLPLVVEARERTGGPFAAPDGAAWRMNSRSRPPSEDRSARPGTEDALNSLGPYAPVQEADLTGESYPTQERLALAARLSVFLSARAVVGTTFVRRFPNTEESRRRLGLPVGEDGPLVGRYLALLRNNQTGETGYVATDAIIIAGGLGAPRSAFRDRSSRAAIRKEQERAGPGSRRCYLAFEDFIAFVVGSPDDSAFPLRGVESVIVIGAGDSGRVAVESLLGYGPQRGLAPQTLDRIREVVWIGQKAAMRDEFLACERPRYHTLAVEFPRGEAGAADPGNARIRPVASRAVRFSVLAGRPTVETASAKHYRADLVIDCAGFGGRKGEERGRPLRLADLDRSLRVGSRLSVCDLRGTALYDATLAVTAVTPESGEGAPRSRRKRYAGVVGRSAGRGKAALLTPFETAFCEPDEVGGALEAALRPILNLPESERLYLKPTVLPLLYLTTGGSRMPVARQEPGESVYYVGPQAGLPAPSGDGPATSGGPLPLLDAGNGENAVALWRYAETVTAFAEHYFANLAGENREAVTYPPAEDSPLELPSATVSPDGSAAVLVSPAFDTHLPVSEGVRRVNSERILRYLIAEHLWRFRLPAALSATPLTDNNGAADAVRLALSVSFTPEMIGAPDGDAAARIRAHAEGPLLRQADPSPLLAAMLDDALLRQIVLMWGMPTKAFARAGKARATRFDLAVRGKRLAVVGEIRRA